jgi:uncharacterized membrane protein YhaH (DUF805 family)
VSWYLVVLKKYAVFAGRARRSEYWNFFLFNLLVTFALAAVDAISGNFSMERGIGLLGGIYTLGVFLPSVAVSVRRLHDTDRSGWWLLAGLIPIVGVILLAVFTMQEGRPSANRFGANPKTAAA